jgi:hypothetical protein
MLVLLFQGRIVKWYGYLYTTGSHALSLVPHTHTHTYHGYVCRVDYAGCRASHSPPPSLCLLLDIRVHEKIRVGVRAREGGEAVRTENKLLTSTRLSVYASFLCCRPPSSHTRLGRYSRYTGATAATGQHWLAVAGYVLWRGSAHTHTHPPQCRHTHAQHAHVHTRQPRAQAPIAAILTQSNKKAP